MVKLNRCDISVCKGMCCYDGVYLNSNDLVKIDEAVSFYPEFFSFIGDEKVIDGDWFGVVKGKKTNIKDWFDNPSNYPSHFTNTRCVFLQDDYKCSLQVASSFATNGENDWKYKPFSCCVFPLESDSEGNLLELIKNKSDDRCNLGETYPGFSTYTYCGSHCDCGEDSKEVLKKEINYFNDGNK